MSTKHVSDNHISVKKYFYFFTIGTLVKILLTIPVIAIIIYFILKQ